MARPSFDRPVRVSPAFQQLSPPTIVVGMHRSGTSLVSGMLSLMGVQMYPDGLPRDVNGHIQCPSPEERINGYAEAEAFFLVNEKVLARAGATWDFVDPFLEVREEAEFEKSSVKIIQSATFSTLKQGFLDKFKDGIRGQWGWKDPRNSLTLGYWLRIFPDASVLHVVRDANEVVDSIQRRSRRWRTETAEEWHPSIAQRAWRLASDSYALKRFVQKRTGKYQPAARPAVTVEDSDYCLRLWDQYVDCCRQFKWLGPRYFEVRYDDILAKPEMWSARMAEFTGLRPSTRQMQSAIDLVETPRALQRRIPSGEHRAQAPYRPGLAGRASAHASRPTKPDMEARPSL